jgi:hypothetical protein
MNRKALKIALTGLLIIVPGVAFACEFKVGETKYLDYAKCKYGEESIQVIELTGSSSWDSCIYYVQAFRPEKLLAVTKDQEGKEMLSINDRSKIGNPCYLTKSSCDSAFKSANETAY